MYGPYIDGKYVTLHGYSTPHNHKYQEPRVSSRFRILYMEVCDKRSVWHIAFDDWGKDNDFNDLIVEAVRIRER